MNTQSYDIIIGGNFMNHCIYIKIIMLKNINVFIFRMKIYKNAFFNFTNICSLNSYYRNLIHIAVHTDTNSV